MNETLAQLPYYRVTELAAEVGGQTVRVVTKPGIPYWQRVSRAALLLADAAEVAPDARVLLLGCGPGALGVALARRASGGMVRLVDTSAIALDMAERTLAANAIGNAAVWPDPVDPIAGASFDVACLEPPNNRKLARRWLLAAHGALPTGGRLYLAGPKDEGIASIIADAGALFGQAVVLGYKEHNRVAVATKTAGTAQPDWASVPGIAQGTWHEFTATVYGQPLHLWSLPGIFSYDRLDEGTVLLLDAAQPLLRRTHRVLDAGCGYGVIGLVVARWGGQAVDLLDANLLAVAAARRNVADLAPQQARVLAGDGIAPVVDERYHLILTNPPFHAGKAVSFDITDAFIIGARQALRPGGGLVLVSNRFLRYDRALREHFSTVEILAETSRFRVFHAS
ncbi:MAG: methyltransferase [Thermomicrobiales bacterium]